MGGIIRWDSLKVFTLLFNFFDLKNYRVSPKRGNYSMVHGVGYVRKNTFLFFQDPKSTWEIIFNFFKVQNVPGMYLGSTTI